MTTARLKLPEITESQAAKHITHNEALQMLDVFAGGSVKSISEQSPPGSPADGDAYFIPGGASGDWSSYVGHVAHYTNSQWYYYLTPSRWLAYIEDDAVTARFNGTSWDELTTGSGGGGGGDTGKAYVDLSGGDATLTAAEGNVPVIQLGGDHGGGTSVTLPALERMWVVANDSDGGVTLTTGSGGTIYLEPGYQYIVFGDGVGIRASLTIAPQGLKMNGDLILPIYSVSSVPDPSTRYMVCVGVTNGDGGDPCLAVSDGGSWKRIALGATISTS